MRRMRILHVLRRMDRGGAETWLVHVLRRIDRERFAMDFLVHSEEPAAYDGEVRALGSRIIPCLHPSRPWAYARNFLRALEEHGPYDVLHSHVHHFSGFVLWLARRAGIRVRIAHSHSDTASLDARAPLPRRVYLRAMEKLVARCATAGLAASRRAAAALFGARWESDPRWRGRFCGIDLDPFRAPVERRGVRREFGLSERAFVIGHAGRFHPTKNHLFLLGVAAELARGVPETRLLLLGDGPLRPAIEARAKELGIRERVVFAGIRADVPRLMKGAMDVFVFPSLHEGLPITILEAQAAALPAVVSTAVPEGAAVLPSLIRRLPLDAGAEKWAEAAIEARAAPPVDPERACALLAASPFSITASVRALEAVYSGGVA
ncbi:MAG: glycosyltransferase [Planctomycetota bacterium]